MKGNEMSTIDVLATGGTLDKTYGNGAGVKNFSFSRVSYVQSIIDRLGVSDVRVDYDWERAKDSLDMTDEDRDFIASWCSDSSRSSCVVTHGTDTMIDTARVVSRRCRDKTVVFTGALQPARMRDSDAEFNLGGALIAARACPHHVYIVMNGRIYPWDKCRKNPITGCFESLS